MMKKILITYATNAGSTIAMAEEAGKTFQKHNAQVDIRPVKDSGDPAAHDAVLVCAPMIVGWHRAAVGFIQAHQQALSQKPVAYLMTALNLTQSPAADVDGIPVYQDPVLAKPPRDASHLSFKENYAKVANYVTPVLKRTPLVRPAAIGLFAGYLDYSKLNFFDRLFVQFIIGAKAGDYRNWDGLRGWVESLSSFIK